MKYSKLIRTLPHVPRDQRTQLNEGDDSNFKFFGFISKIYQWITKIKIIK